MPRHKKSRKRRKNRNMPGRAVLAGMSKKFPGQQQPVQTTETKQIRRMLVVVLSLAQTLSTLVRPLREIRWPLWGIRWSFPIILFPERFELVWPYFARHRLKITLFIVGGMLSVPLQILSSFYMKEIVDHGVLGALGPLLAVEVVLQGVWSYAGYLARVVVIRGIKDLRIAIDVRRAHAVELEVYPAGKFEAKVTDLEYLQNALAEGTAKLIWGVINLVGFLLTMYLLVGSAALVAAAACLVIVAVIRKPYLLLLAAMTTHRDKSSIVNRADRNGCTHLGLTDYLVNNELQDNGRMARSEEANKLLDQDARAQERVNGWDAFIAFVIHYGRTATLVSAFFLAWALQSTPTSVGRAAVFAVLLERYGATLVDLVRGEIKLQRGHIAMRRTIADLITLPQSPAPLAGADLPKSGILEVKDLACQRKGRIVFKNLSFRAYPGRVAAVVGEWGAGKTPLLYTLANLYRPSNGTISIGGKTVEGRTLAKLVYLVLDQTFIQWQLDSLASILRAVRSKASKAEMWEALKGVGVDGSTFPEGFGLESLLVDPSSGWYRLSKCDLRLTSIARALLKKPRPLVVLLDEPLRRSQDQERIWKAILALVELGIIVVLTIQSEDGLEGLGHTDIIDIIDLGPRTTATTSNGYGETATEMDLPDTFQAS